MRLYICPGLIRADSHKTMKVNLKADYIAHRTDMRIFIDEICTNAEQRLIIFILLL